MQRRNFLHLCAGLGGLIAASPVRSTSLAQIPELHMQQHPHTAPPLMPESGRPYKPCTTLNGWSLPFRMNQGVKEFHLVAHPVVREIAPGMQANLWGYNGQSPGPTIEVVQGDKVRIYLTNRLNEPTSIHWHGQLLPNGMDGVVGLNQWAVAPGKTVMYEFEAKHAGTFMYHPHADEMVQMAMGMMGLWITHPKKATPEIADVDYDFCFLINAYDIEPGAYVPQVNTMLDFNLWTWNSRAFPGIDPLIVHKNSKVRIRFGNLTMTNHPIHLHGHRFTVTGTDAGPIPLSARWPEVTVDVAVGQMRQIEFVADNPGDWAFHCHKSHHTMNPMGHKVPTLIGVKQDDLQPIIQKQLPDYMSMGTHGMHEMASMQMPLPDNTLPMSTGYGPFGPIGMGGMFSILQVLDSTLPSKANKITQWFTKGPRVRDVQAPSSPVIQLPKNLQNPSVSVNVVKPKHHGP